MTQGMQKLGVHNSLLAMHPVSTNETPVLQSNPSKCRFVPHFLKDTALSILHALRKKQNIPTPDLIVPGPSSPSWDTFIEDIKYDLKSQIITLHIAHNGPQDAKFFLAHAGPSSWLKTMPPQKIFWIHIPKNGDQKSDIRNRACITINLKDKRYASFTSQPCFTMHFGDTNHCDKCIFFRPYIENDTRWDRDEAFWANVKATR